MPVKIKCKASNSKFKVLNSKFKALNSKFKVSNSESKALYSKFKALYSVFLLFQNISTYLFLPCTRFTIKTIVMIVSKAYSRFNIEVNTSIPYISNPVTTARLKLGAPTVAKFQGLLTQWNNLYPKYTDPSTHTDPVVIDMKVLYKEFYQWTNKLKKHLKYNMEIELTASDLESIYIHTDKHRKGKLPRPEDAPTNQILSQKNHSARISTHIHIVNEKPKRKLPEHVKKIGRKVAITEYNAGPPPDDAYKNLEIIGRSVYTISFKPEESGLKAWLITWYINARGENGPCSPPLAIHII